MRSIGIEVSANIGMGAYRLWRRVGAELAVKAGALGATLLTAKVYGGKKTLLVSSM